MVEENVMYLFCAPGERNILEWAMRKIEYHKFWLDQ